MDSYFWQVTNIEYYLVQTGFMLLCKISLISQDLKKEGRADMSVSWTHKAGKCKSSVYNCSGYPVKQLINLLFTLSGFVWEC